MSREDPRAESRANWEQVAAGWERRNDQVARTGAPVAERMVALLDPQPGETVLDVAAGVGDTGFLAAPRLAPGGRLISSDFAGGMVDAARRRAAALGLDGVEHVVADAQDLPLADASVDGVLCRWAYMLLPDPEAALREAHRVLRPGGRLAFAVWGPAERNPWATLVGRTLVELGHLPPPDPSAPNMFQLADHDKVRRLLTRAGFDEPSLDEVEVVVGHPSFQAYWDTTADMAASVAAVLRRLSPEAVEALKVEVERKAAAFREDGGALRLPGMSVVGLAGRP